METNQSRPVIKIPVTRQEVILEVIGLLGLMGILVFLYLNWARIPDSVPQHFNFSGKVDSWGDKGILFVVPAILGGLYLLLTVLSKYPQHFNYAIPITEENAAAQYLNARQLIRWLKVELVYLFFYIEFQTVQTAIEPNKADALGVLFFLIILLVIFGTLGYFFYQSARKR